MTFINLSRNGSYETRPENVRNKVPKAKRSYTVIRNVYKKSSPTNVYTRNFLSPSGAEVNCFAKYPKNVTSELELPSFGGYVSFKDIYQECHDFHDQGQIVYV